MSSAPTLPKGQARLCVWREGVPSPLIFMVQETVGQAAIDNFNHGRRVGFESVSDKGIKSISYFDQLKVTGLTLEVNTIDLDISGFDIAAGRRTP